MKRFYFTLLVCYCLGFLTNNIFAQQFDRTKLANFCGAMENLEFQKENDPELENKMQEIENFTRKHTRSPFKPSTATITIPVVFHVLYNKEEENLDDAFLYSQIEQLNKDFRKLNDQVANIPDVFTDRTADVGIEFCLATRDPNGYSTSGITRQYTFNRNYSVYDVMKFTQFGGKTAWPTDQYLNIWVLNLLESNVIGYAQFPGGNEMTDGIVMDYRFVGTPTLTGPVNSNFAPGTITAHEVGHWLNLRHIWGDGDCSVDDFVEDTPLQGAPSGNLGLPCTFPGPNTCDEGEGDLPDNFQNFMDYSAPSCLSMFTEGQKERMLAQFMPGGPRASFLESKGCSTSPFLVRQSRCTDGIQNGSEEGVDCGGNCNPCPERESGYCPSFGIVTAEEWIESISIGNYTNNSGNDGGYGNFIDQQIFVNPGTAYDLTITPGFSDIIYPEHYKVYIDYNQDNDFEDADELVYDTETVVFDEQTAELFFPYGITGQRRMRIIMSFAEPSFLLLPPTDCGVNIFAETEEYTLRFPGPDDLCPGTTCHAFRANGRLVVNWDAVPGATTYQVRYASRGGLWTYYTTNNTSFRLIDDGKSSYTFQIRAKCEVAYSAWSHPAIVKGSAGRNADNTASFKLTRNGLPVAETKGLKVSNVYPNPTTDILNFDLSTAKETPVAISVMDVMGRVIIAKEFRMTEATTQQIEVTNYAPGIYYLTVQSGAERVTKKFVKMR